MEKHNQGDDILKAIIASKINAKIKREKEGIELPKTPNLSNRKKREEGRDMI